MSAGALPPWCLDLGDSFFQTLPILMQLPYAVPPPNRSPNTQWPSLAKTRPETRPVKHTEPMIHIDLKHTRIFHFATQTHACLPQLKPMIKPHKLYRLIISTIGTHQCYTDDAKPVSNVFSVQALSAKTNKMRLPNPDTMHGGRAPADMAFSREEETMKMVLLLGSFQQIYYS